MFVPGICGVFDLWVVSIEPLADYDLVEFCFLQPQEFLVFTYCHKGIEIKIIFYSKIWYFHSIDPSFYEISEDEIENSAL